MRAKVFPDHWSVLLGQISVFSFVVVAISGVVLTFFYDPSMERVTYAGSYGPLTGVDMSRAFASTLDISFEVRGGLLVRQVHLWSSLVMTAAIVLHLLWLFFAGAFRGPRRRSWLIVVTLLVVTMAAGMTGLALPDDLLSGTSMAVLDGVLTATPVVGTWLSALLFGGAFPGDVNALFYPVHVVVLPAALAIAFVAKAIVGLRHKPAEYAGRERTKDNPIGTNLRAFVAKSAGLFLIMSGVIVLMAATLTVNPIWQYGPADPASATAGSSPNWSLAFLDGALRLAPGWEFVWMGRTWSVAVLLPVLVCTLFFAIVAAYPYLEQWVTGDSEDHHLLERPRNNPTRTGIGVAGIVFYGVLWAAAGSNTIAVVFGISVEGFMHALQVLLVIGPVAGFDIARRICIGLQRRDRAIVLHGRETGQLVRTRSGGYAEVHLAVDAAERQRLADYEDHPPVPLQRDVHGQTRLPQRLQVRLSQLFYRDRIAPLAKAEMGRDRHDMTSTR
ncbi:cytochrome b N-terminal domain-containing protein [Actinopolymorpha sp. B17G11]|uniref:cytochrome bc1 complex cytochrome b subunit n=1 Tax=Actinopolymorpha sp. B17G11 TaxID=3160861 RepID=UPI0032E3A16D